MEGDNSPLPSRRDINELLTTGYFKTTRGKSPSGGTPTTSNAPYFLRPSAFEYDAPSERSRSRGRSKPPPRPTVEDEVVSLSRESLASQKLSWQSYDPPSRGILNQNPIILESDISKAEAARLQEIPCAKDRDDDVNPENRKRAGRKDDNPERRFVLIPKSDTYDPNEESEVDVRKGDKSQKPSKDEPRRDERRESARQERPKREEKKDSYRGDALRPEERRPSDRPGAERRRSRQDLPVLETKVPREIPPQYRRSASAFSGVPKDFPGTPRTAAAPGTPAESFLSPEVSRPPKEFSSQSVPRQNIHEALWGKIPTSGTDQKSGPNSSGSRPGTPEKRNSGNFETAGRPPAEKLTRPQQLAGDIAGRRQERHPSPAKSSKSSTHSAHYYSSSEDDLGSDDDHYRRRPRRDRDERRLRSPSRSNRSSLDVKNLSKFSSPLPSPKVSPSQIPTGEIFERTDSFPPSVRDKKPNSRPVSPFSPDKEGRVDRLTAVDPTRPKSRQSSAVPIPKPTRSSLPLGAIPIPIPSGLHTSTSSSDVRRSPSTPQFEESKPLGPRPQPQPQAQQKPFWQPPPFQPPPQTLEKPMGSFRRFSEDVERGQIAPLPTCPRTTYTRGRNDWLTLPQCPAFDICPSCFASTIAPTEFRTMFVQAPRRSPDTPILCDFGSSPWYRIAWLLTLKEKRRDLKLFYGLANIAANVQQCLGKHEAVRQWHSVNDPKTGSPIKGFDVCYSCVRSVEVLLPAVRGVFVRADSYGSSMPRICDLRFDSKRFIQYFDALETTADLSADMDKPPDTWDLVYLCRKLALVPECQQDTDLNDRRWHTITQLPEFTVCEECYDEVVYPEIEDGKAVAKLFSKDLKRVPRASCQLYGERMRGVFRLAVDSGDYKLLASQARDRRVAEEEYKRAMADLKRQPLGNPGIEREIKRREEEWSRWE